MTEYSPETMRRAMVASQLRTTEVNDSRVVAAMGAVAREAFVPAERAGVAYVDTPVPLGNGRALNAPMATGRLITEAQPRATDRALVIGAATGYSAAVLARLVASVVAVEDDQALLASARAAGLPASVTLVDAPLAGGWAEGAPYDLILIDGAVEAIPDAVVAQLAENGRITAAVVDNGVTRLSAGRKVGGAFGVTAFADVEAPILPGFAKPVGFTF